MYMKANTIDDLLRRVLAKLLTRTTLIRASRGESREINGVMLRLTEPRARISRSEGRGKPFSALGELLWYLAGTNKLSFIEYYIPAYRHDSADGQTLHGAYGPRLFASRGVNQIQNVIDLLKAKPTSRRAVVQIFDAADLSPAHKEIPCTCTLQFMVRGGKLLLFAYMRSNDAWLRLPHDVFCFTMLQEIVARSLGIEPGDYTHAVGSLHLYVGNEAGATAYIAEGWQSAIPMPAMPPGDPWTAVATLVRAESSIRRNGIVPKYAERLPSYWADLARLLRAFRIVKTQKSAPRLAAKEIRTIRDAMQSSAYDTYLAGKEEAIAPALPMRGRTLDLFAKGDST